MGDPRVQPIKQILTPFLIRCPGKVPWLPSDRVQLVYPVRSAQTHRSDSYGKVHLATEHLEEGHSLAKHQLGDPLRCQVNSAALRKLRNGLGTVPPQSAHHFRSLGWNS